MRRKLSLLMCGLLAATSLLTPIKANAETTNVGIEIQATTIDITVPLNVACTIDPNTDNGFVSSDIVIVNNTKCPVTLSISDFSAQDGSYFAAGADILPDGLPDGLEWDNLTKAQTQQYFALGIYAKDAAEWQAYNLVSPLYVADIATNGETDLGVINSESTINMALTANYGKAFAESSTFNYQITWIAELY